MRKVIKLKCHYCKKIFERILANHSRNIKEYSYRYKHTFCNRKCFNENKRQMCLVKTTCGTCHKNITTLPSEVKKSKSGKSFCSKSCAATHNNKLKRKSRRSKIEAKFYNLLVKEFPNLTILPNDKTMLNGLETDVAIPSLKLAIEWNGIVHFKPIYGQTKLDKIQNIDAKKLKIAANKNINLIVIPDLVSNDRIPKQAFNDVKAIIKKLI